MPLEEMVFGEGISRQEDEASGWIVAHSRKKQRQDFTPGDSPGPSAGHRAARPAHPKGPINKLIAASRLPRLPKDHYRVVNVLTYRLPERLPRSELFRKVSLLEKSFPLEYAIVGENTLEQVFLSSVGADKGQRQ
ncbi:hypothetical protein MRX96_019673 [Rhipicephalus microplus]